MPKGIPAYLTQAKGCPSIEVGIWDTQRRFRGYLRAGTAWSWHTRKEARKAAEWWLKRNPGCGYKLLSPNE